MKRIHVTLEDMPGWQNLLGINDIYPSASRQSNAIYSITGQRVSNASRGIFIINGRKVLK